MLVINIHDLSPHPISEWSFAPDELKWLLDFLLQRGYQFVSLGEWSSNNRSPLSCALTFDDCRLGAYRYGLEILSSRNIRASFFPVSSYLMGEEVPVFEAYSKFATKLQLKEVASAGHSIGSHGRRHLPYFYLNQADIFEDLCESKSELENIFGVEIATISIPYGQLNVSTVQLAHKAGYRQILSADSGWNKSFLQLPFLKRISVRSTCSRDNLVQELLEAEAYRDELLIADCSHLPTECWEWPSIYRLRSYDVVVVGSNEAKMHLERYGVWNVLESSENILKADVEQFVIERALPKNIPIRVTKLDVNGF